MVLVLNSGRRINGERLNLCILRSSYGGEILDTLQYTCCCVRLKENSDTTGSRRFGPQEGGCARDRVGGWFYSNPEGAAAYQGILQRQGMFWACGGHFSVVLPVRSSWCPMMVTE